MRLEALLRSHGFMRVERPPEIWEADTEDWRLLPLLGEMIASGLGTGTPLDQLTLSAANIVVEAPEDGADMTSPLPGEYVALTVRGVADYGPDDTWCSTAPSRSGLLSRLHQQLETAGARFAYIRRMPPHASITVFFSRLSILIAILLSGCRPDRAGEHQRPVADVKQVMTAILEPAAETYWDAVGTVIDTTGIHETVPQSAEAWAEVYRAALLIAESGNLLMMEGRAPDRGEWMRLSRLLVEAGSRAATAAESRDVAKVFDAGGELYEACTACHSAYARETLRPSHDQQ